MNHSRRFSFKSILRPLILSATFVMGSILMSPSASAAELSYNLPTLPAPGGDANFVITVTGFDGQFNIPNCGLEFADTSDLPWRFNPDPVSKGTFTSSRDSSDNGVIFSGNVTGNTSVEVKLKNPASPNSASLGVHTFTATLRCSGPGPLAPALIKFSEVKSSTGSTTPAASAPVPPATPTPTPASNPASASTPTSTPFTDFRSTFTPAPIASEPVPMPASTAPTNSMGTSTAPVQKFDRQSINGITLQPVQTLGGAAATVPQTLPTPAATIAPVEVNTVDAAFLALAKMKCPEWMLFGTFPRTIQVLKGFLEFSQRNMIASIPGSQFLSTLINVPHALAQSLNSNSKAAALTVGNGGADLIFDLLAKQQKSLNVRKIAQLKKAFKQGLTTAFSSSAPVNTAVFEKSLAIARSAPYSFTLDEVKELKDDTYEVTNCKNKIGLPAIFKTKSTGLTIRCLLTIPAADNPSQEVPLATIDWALKGSQLVANMSLPRLKAVEHKNGFLITAEIDSTPLILNQSGEGFVLGLVSPALEEHMSVLLNSVATLIITGTDQKELTSIAAPLGGTGSFAFVVQPRGLLDKAPKANPIKLNGYFSAFE